VVGGVLDYLVRSGRSPSSTGCRSGEPRRSAAGARGGGVAVVEFALMRLDHLASKRLRVRLPHGEDVFMRLAPDEPAVALEREKLLALWDNRHHAQRTIDDLKADPIWRWSWHAEQIGHSHRSPVLVPKFVASQNHREKRSFLDWLLRRPVELVPDGPCIVTENGRHRTVWLLVHGATVIPAWAYNGAGDADRLEALAGASEDQTAEGLAVEGEHTRSFVDS
jgi:hypothetical protein